MTEPDILESIALLHKRINGLSERIHQNAATADQNARTLTDTFQALSRRVDDVARSQGVSAEPAPTGYEHLSNAALVDLAVGGNHSDAPMTRQSLETELLRRLDRVVDMG